MPLTTEDILKRAEKAQQNKENWRSVYEEAYEYCLPQRNLYDGYWEGGQSASGTKKMGRVFDSTAIHSTQRFANRIQSGIFPPQRKWCRLTPGPDIPGDRKEEAQAILDKYTEIMFSVLRQSNFDIAIGEFLLDLAVGTAVMLVQPGDAVNPISFEPVPQYLISFEEGANGKVDNVYRKMRLKGEAIQRQWRDAELSEQLQAKIKTKPTDEIELLEATVFDYERGDFEYVVIVKDGKEEILRKRMKTSPWIVSRYMKVSGEIYGRGPVLTAMPDVKTLNKTLELLLKNASLAIAGVYTAADDGVLNPQTVRIVPGSIIPVARNGGPQGESLRALPRAGDFDVSQIVINDMRMNIKKTLLDESLPPDNMSARSATEIVERMKELAQNLGSAFGRLINETMIPLVARILDVMDTRGLIDMPLKVNGLEVRVLPSAPLANAQYMEEVNAAIQFAQIAQGMGPTGVASIDEGALVDFVADKLGVPAQVRRSGQVRDQYIQQQQQQQAQAAMAAAQAGQAMGVSPDKMADVAMQGGM